MYQMIILIIVAVAGISYATYSALEKTDSKMADYRIAKSAISIDNRRIVQSLGTANPIQNNANLQDVSQSNLIVDQISLDEQILINKLQNAVKTTIVDNNSTEPNCADLAATGLITAGECAQIKDKKQNYLSIENGEINISSAKINKIVYANIKQINEGEGIIQENTFLKINTKIASDNENNAKRILESIKLQDTKEGISSALTNINVIANLQPQIAKEILYTATKKLETLPNSEEIKTVINSATLIADEKILLLKTAILDTTKTLSTATNQMEENPSYSKEIWGKLETTTFINQKEIK